MNVDSPPTSAARAKARILHLTSAHRWNDTRIFFKECRTLARHGYDVTLLAPGAPDESRDGVTLRGVPSSRGRLGRMTTTLYRIWRAAKSQRADLYHFHDPELIPVGMLLKSRGSRVVYDVHENLPAQLLVKAYIRPAFLRRVLAGLARAAEGFAARRLDGFSAAAPSIARRFPAERTALVRNLVDLDFVDSIEAPARPASGRPFVVIYPGSLSRARGILNAIRAIAMLDGSAELKLAGKWHDPAFRRECESEPGWRFCRYLGRISPAEVIAAVKDADAGIHVPLPSPNYSDGLAVKGFEFMACSKPFVTTDEPGKRRTFGNCALFVDATSPRDIAAAIGKLRDDAALAQSLGEAGRGQVADSFAWGNESVALLGLYTRLLAGDDRAGGGREIDMDRTE